MNELVGEVIRIGEAHFHWIYYCLREDGSRDDAISWTLLDLIEISWLDHEELSALVRRAEAGQYISPNPALPDWGYNDINIWLVEPMAPRGTVCVTNENTSYSSDAATLQRFTYEQFWHARECWARFIERIEFEGKEALVGKPIKFPGWRASA